jgi:hypothetical protein
MVGFQSRNARPFCAKSFKRALSHFMKNTLQREFGNLNLGEAAVDCKTQDDE